jgi:NAD(P)-dependent dehydrogenase (short-subunit alcohol dehydrogenase family)
LGGTAAVKTPSPKAHRASKLKVPRCVVIKLLLLLRIELIFFKAAAFPLKAYDHTSIHAAFEAIKKQWPGEPIRVTLWNAGFGAWKGFLDVTPEQWQENAQTNLIAPAAFARESILAFKGYE